jgi:hypothetical protein
MALPGPVQATVVEGPDDVGAVRAAVDGAPVIDPAAEGVEATTEIVGDSGETALPHPASRAATATRASRVRQPASRDMGRVSGAFVSRRQPACKRLEGLGPSAF